MNIDDFSARIREIFKNFSEHEENYRQTEYFNVTRMTVEQSDRRVGTVSVPKLTHKPVFQIVAINK